MICKMMIPRITTSPLVSLIPLPFVFFAFSLLFFSLERKTKRKKQSTWDKNAPNAFLERNGRGSRAYGGRRRPLPFTNDVLLVCVGGPSLVGPWPIRWSDRSILRFLGALAAAKTLVITRHHRSILWLVAAQCFCCVLGVAVARFCRVFFCLCFVPVLVCGIRRFARDVEVGPWRMWPGKIVGGTSRPMSSFRFCCCCCCWRWWWRRGETTVIAWCSAESRVQDHVTGSKTAHERYLHFSRKLLVNQQKKSDKFGLKKLKFSLNIFNFEPAWKSGFHEN